MALAVSNIGQIDSGSTITLTDGAAVGDRVYFIPPDVAVVGAGYSSVSDSQGNTWSATATGWFVTDVTTALAAGDTITGTPATPGYDLAAMAVRITGGAVGTWAADNGFYAGASNFASLNRSAGGGSLAATDFKVLNPAAPSAEVTLATATTQGSQASPGTPSLPDALAGPGTFTHLGFLDTGAFPTVGGINRRWRCDVHYRVHTGAGPFSVPAKNGTSVDGGASLYAVWDQWRSLTVSLVYAYDLSEAVSPTGRRLRAYLSSEALKVDRLSDAFPPTVGATVTVETADVTACSLDRELYRRGGKAELAYVKSGTVYLRTSTDGGRTWSVADTIATGYQDVERLIDAARGIALVALWKESESKIYLSVGTLDAAGEVWTYSTPAVLVSSARRGFSLLRDRAGRYALSYRNTSDALLTVYCSSLTKAGVGTFS